MINAAQVALTANRWTPFAYIIAVQGVDLTNANLHAQVRLYPNAPGTPVIDLPPVTDPTVLGVRLMAVDTTGALPISYIRLQIPGASLGSALPSGDEISDDLTLAWDMVVTLPGYTEARWLYGPFTVAAGVTQLASAVLANDPSPIAPDAIATIAGQALTITIASAALLAPLLGGTQAAAAAAATAAEQAEAAAEEVNNLVNTADSSRSGWHGSIFDAAMRRLSGYKHGTSLFYQFTAAVFNKTLTVKGQLISTAAKLGGSNVAFRPWSIRSGWLPGAMLDADGKVFFGIRTTGKAYVLGKQVLTTDDQTASVGIQDESLTSPSWRVGTVKDSNGFFQIRSRSRLGLGAFLLTTLSANNYEPRIVDDTYVTYKSDRLPSAPYGLFYQPLTGGTEKPVYGLVTKVTVQGDSLSANGSSAFYPAFQLLYPNVTMSNATAIGGTTVPEIAARWGSSPAHITVSGNSIAGGGASTAVTRIDVDLLRGPGSAAGTQTGSIGGVHGTISRANGATFSGTLAGNTLTISNVAGSGAIAVGQVMSGQGSILPAMITAGSGSTWTYDGPAQNTSSATMYSGAYSFISDAGAVTTAVPAGTPFVPDILTTAQDDILCIWGGTNDPNATRDIPLIAGMIAAARPLYKRIIILSALNRADETEGTAGWLAVTQFNSALRAAFPEYFAVGGSINTSGPDVGKLQDLRQALVARGTPTEIANDITSAADRVDPTHLNTQGGTFAAAFVSTWANEQLLFSM